MTTKQTHKPTDPYNVTYDAEERYLEYLFEHHREAYDAEMDRRAWAKGLESQWREEMRQHPKGLQTLLALFPEEKASLKRTYKQHLKDLKAQQRQLLTEVRDARNQTATSQGLAKAHSKWLEDMLAEQLGSLQDSLRQVQWQLDSFDPVEREGTITEQDIESARQVPLEQFTETRRLGRNRVTRCIFHNDSHPSLNIFPDNKFKCFACGAGGDNIDFIKQLHNLEFLDAVKWLLNK